MTKLEEKISKLKKMIHEEGLIFGDKQRIISPGGNETSWIFDLRNIFLKPEPLDMIAEIFWSIFEKEYPFQVGGKEVAAIPLLSAIIIRSQQIGKTVNGFIIRKSRKPQGLQKIIEGEVTDKKIILVDDLINSGSTIAGQIKVLFDIGRKVDFVFTLVNFRDRKNIDKLKDYGISLYSLFTLSDFGLSLDEDRLEPPQENFEAIWRFQSPDPNYFYRVPKSAPSIDEEKIYFGTDSGYFYALRQEDGSVTWKFKVGYPSKGKSIISSPEIYGGKVYFGSYDGNVYALDKNTGKLCWKYMDADFVGSSPAIAPNLGLLFIGLEFGLIWKKGGIAALNLKTGKKVWDFKMPRFTHCSPAYCHSKKVVAIGSNDGYVYLFGAKNGKLKWKFKTGGEIKASLAFDEKRNLLLFGSFDKNMYALDIDSGELKGKYVTRELIYSTPKIHGHDVFFSSLDKNLYSVNLDSGQLNWRFETNGRIFSSPEIVDDKVLIGSNDGILYEIDIQTGKAMSIFQTTERITNKIAYNEKTKRYFLPTYANEIYCLKRHFS